MSYYTFIGQVDIDRDSSIRLAQIVFSAVLCHQAAVLLTHPYVLSLQYGAEFRRFSVDRVKPGKFEDFYKLIVHVHRIANMEVMIGYADIHGDLLPINNDDNFCKAVSTAHPLLRVFIQRQGEDELD